MVLKLWEDRPQWNNGMLFGRFGQFHRSLWFIPCLWGRHNEPSYQWDPIWALGTSWNGSILFVLSWLASFTWHAFKVHPCCTLCQNFLPFWEWIMFHPPFSWIYFLVVLVFCCFFFPRNSKFISIDYFFNLFLSIST